MVDFGALYDGMYRIDNVILDTIEVLIYTIYTVTASPITRRYGSSGQ